MWKVGNKYLFKGKGELRKELLIGHLRSELVKEDKKTSLSTKDLLLKKLFLNSLLRDQELFRLGQLSNLKEPLCGNLSNPDLRIDRLQDLFHPISQFELRLQEFKIDNLELRPQGDQKELKFLREILELLLLFKELKL